jgi:hypothetical protein
LHFIVNIHEYPHLRIKKHNEKKQTSRVGLISG